MQRRDRDGLFVAHIVPTTCKRTVKIQAVMNALNSIQSRESVEGYSICHRRMGNISKDLIKEMILCER